MKALSKKGENMQICFLSTRNTRSFCFGARTAWLDFPADVAGLAVVEDEDWTKILMVTNGRLL